MDGVINVLKPPGMTSHDVVAYLRRILKIKKIGHTGTLDPGAAGVLPICIGKGTKIVEYIQSQEKEYICEITLGRATDTYDKYGNFISDFSFNCYDLKYEDVQKNINKYIGAIEQIPPMYSAIKINGQRAYDIARSGNIVEMPKRKVIIRNIEIIDYRLPKILLRVECSKGTYIRSLCNDIGKSLGVNGYMSFLLRTRTGNFSIRNSVPLNYISESNFKNFSIKMQDALEFPAVFVDDSKRKYVLNGNRITVLNETEYDGLVKIILPDNEFAGIGRLQKNTLIPEKILT